jgi:mono/diheme cytochrome c family protein
MRTTLLIFGLTAAATSTCTWAADAKAGQAVYDKSCKGCHGPDGAGNPAIAKMFKVEIRDLKSPDVQALSNTDLKKVITDGKGKMKPVASVSGAAADNVVAYIRSLK